VGGSTAANVHAAELAANAATSTNTANTIVERDASGNFSAGTITATSVNVTGKLQEGGNDLIPRGVIVMWSGTTAPNGWALCDGVVPGTPDLSGRFIVAKGSNGTTSYNVGDTGGADRVILATSEMPSHTHTATVSVSTNLQVWYRSFTGSNDPQRVIYYTGDGADLLSFTGNVTANIASTGGGASHENRPPYYALAYIMKL
jgi:microcystin-dependent protein